MKKSYILQILLTLLFGVFGLFYSNLTVALLSLVIVLLFGVSLGVVTGGLGALLVVAMAWIVAQPVGVVCVANFNEKNKRRRRRRRR